MGVIFSHIENLFSKSEWDVGYISATQLKICASLPIKSKAHLFGQDFTNSVHFSNLRNCIVLIRNNAIPGDYNFYEEAVAIMRKSNFKKWQMIYTNFKEAALQAGLGVRAKNSLIYSYRFGFDSKICVIGFDNEITDPPTDKKVNKKLWDTCTGCNDCMINCPAKAIHHEGDNSWLDGAACDDFIGAGDHPRIPSLKKYQEKGYTPMGSFGGLYKDGKIAPVSFCRECTSQPRCSKWNGKYPYPDMEKI